MPEPLTPADGARFYGRVEEIEGEFTASTWAANDTVTEPPTSEVLSNVEAAKLYIDSVAIARGFDPLDIEIEWC